MKNGPVQIDYLPQIPRRRWLTRHRMMIGIVVAWTAGMVFWLAPAAVRRARLLHYQHRCMTMSLPPDAVCALDDEFYGPTPDGRGKQLLNPIPKMRLAPDVPSPPSFDVDRMLGMMDTIPLRHTQLQFGRNLIFVHGMRRPDQQERLVVIYTNGVMGPPGRKFMPCYFDIIAPGDMWRNPKEVLLPPNTPQLPDFTRSITVYAGQPDPNNPSHFTIACDIDGQRVTVDGWLRNDDTVLLQQRSSAEN